MLKDVKIRLATEDDSNSILNIYAPFITDTAVTFEYQIPSISEFKNRMANIQKNYPWLVCEIDNKVVGYAYASRFREREAYKWSVDLSIYIKPEYHRKNIGKAFYFALCELLKLQGYYNACAVVTLPNDKSERFHESFGFETVGVYHKVGYKLGSWHDVKLFELTLKEHVDSPEVPRPIGEIVDTDEFRAIIKKAEAMVKAD